MHSRTFWNAISLFIPRLDSSSENHGCLLSKFDHALLSAMAFQGWLTVVQIWTSVMSQLQGRLCYCDLTPRDIDWRLWQLSQSVYGPLAQSTREFSRVRQWRVTQEGYQALEDGVRNCGDIATFEIGGASMYSSPSGWALSAAENVIRYP